VPRLTPKEVLKYDKAMVFQVQILGVGDYFTEVHNHTSFVITANGSFTLVECPGGLRRMLHEANRIADMGVRLEAIRHVVVTHLHGDHSNGLEGLAFFKKFFQAGERPYVYSTREVLKDLWPQKLKASLKHLYTGPPERIGTLSVGQMRKACQRADLEDYFIPVSLEFNHINRVNNLEVEIHAVKHHVPTFGLRAMFEGKALGYSSDTFFDLDLIDFLRDCDMIIHECDFQRSAQNQGIHTHYRELVSLPEPIKKKLYLIHYPDTASQQDSELKLLEQGRVYDIS
jgi:ribonuclease BN (tRNA processing enzyme)